MVGKEIYTLEDKNEYEVIDTLEIENFTYLLLAQVNNLKNIVIRNLVYNTSTGEEHIQRLSYKEFEEIYKKFEKKNKNLFD